MSDVSIITRTKNREVLLWRALRSVASQDFKGEIEWIIVNDGGLRNGVEDVAKAAKNLGINVMVLHLKQPTFGMEDASVQGVNVSTGKYLVIHDDDDSWESEFLTKTVSAIDSNNTDAVVTRIMGIFEKIEGNHVVTEHAQEWNQGLKKNFSSSNFHKLEQHNFWPPISMLFTRRIYDEVGGFDPKIRVLGDWDFNLRLWKSTEIYFLPEILANYHLRFSGQRENLNSIVNQSEHFYASEHYIRHKLREQVFLGAVIE